VTYTLAGFGSLALGRRGDRGGARGIWRGKWDAGARASGIRARNRLTWGPERRARGTDAETKGQLSKNGAVSFGPLVRPPEMPLGAGRGTRIPARLPRPGSGGERKGAQRALTVHGLPHRIQIRCRARGPRPGAATARHGGGRGRRAT
jgi:hypothetical protein